MPTSHHVVTPLLIYYFPPNIYFATLRGQHLEFALRCQMCQRLSCPQNSTYVSTIYIFITIKINESSINALNTYLMFENLTHYCWYQNIWCHKYIDKSNTLSNCESKIYIHSGYLLWCVIGELISYQNSTQMGKEINKAKTVNNLRISISFAIV